MLIVIPRLKQLPVDGRRHSLHSRGLEKVRIATSTPSTSCTRAMTRVASSECPPSSKKLSATPTRSKPRTSAQMPAKSPRSVSRGDETRGLGPRFARLGQRLAIDLAVGVSGNASSSTKTPGIMYSGKRCFKKARSSDGKSGLTAAGHEVGRQTFVARLVFPRQDDRLSYRRVLQQHRLDLAQLDPVAPDLDLLIDPTQDTGCRHRADTVPGPRSYTGARRAGREGVGDELLSGQLRAVQVAAGHAGAADAELARNPDRHRLEPASST